MIISTKDVNHKKLVKLRKDFIKDAASKDHNHCFFLHENKWYDGADLIMKGFAHFYQKMIDISTKEGKNVRFIIRPKNNGIYRLSHFKILKSEYSNN